MSEVNNSLREATAIVNITGTLKKKELERKTGDRGEYISGHIIVETEPGNEIRLDTFVNKMTKGTADKPSQESSVWKNQIRVLDEYVSMTDLMKQGQDEATARANATKFSVRARLGLNDYPDREGNMVSTTRLNANFSYFSRVEASAFVPCARFEIEGFIIEKRPEMKGDDETGRLLLKMVVPGYQGIAQPMDFVVSKEATEYVNDHYEVAQTVHVYGDVVHRIHTITKQKAGFMKSETETTTTVVNELLIDNGEPEAYDEENSASYNPEAIRAAMRYRENEYLPEIKRKAAEKKAAPSAPANGFANAGFGASAPTAPKTGFTY